MAHFTHLGWSRMLKPFWTDYDHQGPLPGVDRILCGAGNLENWIPWISLYLAGSMTLTDGCNGQETPLRNSLAWDLDFTDPTLTFYSFTIRSRG